MMHASSRCLLQLGTRVYYSRFWRDMTFTCSTLTAKMYSFNLINDQLLFFPVYLSHGYTQKQRDKSDAINGNSTHFRRSWKAFIVLHLAIHLKKSDQNTGVSVWESSSNPPYFLISAHTHTCPNTVWSVCASQTVGFGKLQKKIEDSV